MSAQESFFADNAPPVRRSHTRCILCGLELAEIPNDLGAVMLVAPKAGGPYAIHAGILRVLTPSGYLLERGSTALGTIRRLKKGETRYGPHVSSCAGLAS